MYYPDRDLLESLQFEAACLVTGALKGTQRKNLLKETAWFSLKERRNNHILTMVYKLINNLVPLYLSELCPKYVKSTTNYDLRANDHLIVPFSRTKRFKDSFLISSINLWNNLPESICSSYNELLSKITKENKTCYIMGDFNLNLLSFQQHLLTGEFLEQMYSNTIFPLILRPSRITSHSATLIDNILTNQLHSNMKSGLLFTDISVHLPIFCVCFENNQTVNKN